MGCPVPPGQGEDDRALDDRAGMWIVSVYTTVGPVRQCRMRGTGLLTVQDLLEEQHDGVGRGR